MSAPSLQLERRHAGAVWHLNLDAPPGHILDQAMCAALLAALRQVEADPKSRLLILSSNGANFSFGASLAEHRREHAASMLQSMRELLLAFHGSSIPSLALIRGYCLGGGFELAMTTTWMAALEDARFGLPEISLALIPPFALGLLSRRIAGAVAEDWILSGRHVGAREAEAAGLVRVVLTEAEVEAWLSSFLAREILPRSAPVLRLLRSAVREQEAAALEQAFLREEQRYLNQLLPLEDAHEGLEAFLQRRPARFRHA